MIPNTLYIYISILTFYLPFFLTFYLASILDILSGKLSWYSIWHYLQLGKWIGRGQVRARQGPLRSRALLLGLLFGPGRDHCDLALAELRSGRDESDQALAVRVRRGPSLQLRSGRDHAVWSWAFSGSGGDHCDLALAVEVRWRRRRRWRPAAIKSKNPHLTGEEFEMKYFCWCWLASGDNRWLLMIGR